MRKLYLDGDFEEAIRILETALKSKAPFDHADSVLIFKHLGVMYAANYETREKGKYYMHQLLAVEPTARIMDMYASDMIYMIFKNIQDEFESSRMKYERMESNLTAANPPKTGDTRPEPAPKARSSRSTWIWLGATGAVVAAGAVAYFVLADEPATTVENHQVPP